MTTLPSLIRERVRAEQDRRKRMAAMKEEAEKDFLAFVRMVWPILEPEKPLVEGWIIDLIADTLMAISDGQLTRVCLNVPPGSMKSSMLNVLWPAWEWGPCNHPSYRYLSISYSTVVPVRDNLRFAQVIKHPVYQACWGDRVKVTRDGAEWVANDKTGWKAVTSVSGSTTGLRGDRLLLDDLNNPMDVESDVVRDATNRFVREVMPSRVNDLAESAIINLQQRTHQNDASGTLLEHGQGYSFVSVPAEFDPLRVFPVVLRRDEDGEPTDVWIDPRSLDENGDQLEGLTTNDRGEPVVRFGSPMAKAEGESFWPERFPEDELLRLKTGMTAYSWDSQFNQIPGVRGGATIRRDWWKLWTGDYPEFGTVIASLDTAYEMKETADFNALTVWGAFAGVDGEPLFLMLDAWKVRAPLAELVRRLVETCRARRVDYLLVEHRTRGRDVYDELVRQFQNMTWETVLYEPGTKDKSKRLEAVSPLFSGDVRRLPDGGKDENGKPTFIETWTGGIVYAPDRAWADEVITETASFPYAAHDDYVDTVSMVLSWARKNGVALRRTEWDEMEYERNKFKKPHKVPYAIVPPQ